LLNKVARTYLNIETCMKKNQNTNAFVSRKFKHFEKNITGYKSNDRYNFRQILQISLKTGAKRIGGEQGVG
jgi:hypothetical protein